MITNKKTPKEIYKNQQNTKTKLVTGSQAGSEIILESLCQQHSLFTTKMLDSEIVQLFQES